MEKACYTCKHHDLPLSEEPCRSCATVPYQKGLCSLWISNEEWVEGEIIKKVESKSW